MEIMNTFASRSASVCTACALVLGSAASSFAAEIILHKVPAFTVDQTPAFPENLARQQLGARAEISSAAGEQEAAEAALLSGDPSARYPLPVGTTTVTVALPKIENIDAIGFHSAGAKGQVTIATANAKLSADSPQWRNAAEQSLTGNVQAKIGPSEAKYVRLTFNVTEPGSIAGFGVYATPAASDFTGTRRSAADPGLSMALVSYNHTGIHAQARAVYVTSGDDLRQANRMIDDQVATSYSFGPQDRSPAAVIDLGTARSVRRVSAVYSPRRGKMAFYVLPSLPNTGADQAAGAMKTPDTIAMDEVAFAGMTAVAVTEDDGSQGRASVEIPETDGRYVMVRWLPADQQDKAFTLAEIAAIGGAPNRLLAANTANPTGMSADTEGETGMTDGKTMLDGKTMIDAKDMPGEGPAQEPQAPAEGPPPTLPQPPPFTFVPVLVPTSP
jgi:hypothetical protein